MVVNGFPQCEFECELGGTSQFCVLSYFFNTQNSHSKLKTAFPRAHYSHSILKTHTQNCLVELPGVEPGSKQETEKLSTCLACLQLSGCEREQAPWAHP